MADKSKIEWTEATWNPVTGCTKVSPGCDHCYAETFAERWRGIKGHAYENGFDLQLRLERLDQPLRWTRPRRVFVNSMSDLFQDGVPDWFIAKVFGVMAGSPQHTFQVLTKRHGRMRGLVSSEAFREAVYVSNELDQGDVLGDHWPLPNVWLGVSVEDQKWASIRIPALIDTPAAVRWLSCEPLLGRLNLGQWLFGQGWPSTSMGRGVGGMALTAERSPIQWLVVGGESGPGARPMDPEWARALRDDCALASVPFFFKQWGGVRAKANGRELDGRTWDEYPVPS